jgi:hypothetical protein
MCVELPTEAKAAQLGGGGGEGGEDEMVRAERVVREHAAEDRERERGGARLGDGGEEGGVEAQVPARRFVEQAAGVGEEAGLGVGGDEEYRGGSVEGETLLEETRVRAADRPRRARRGADGGCGGGREHA